MAQSFIESNPSKYRKKDEELYFSDEEEQKEIKDEEDKGGARVEEREGKEGQEKVKIRPYCGCGQSYTCTSMLYLHIRTKHAGITPQGTVGGPKGMIKKYRLHEQSIPQKINYPLPQRLPFEYQDQVTYQSERFSSNHSYQDEDKATIKICQLCGKVYNSITALKFHIKKKHSQAMNEVQTQIKRFECPLCDRTYGTKSALGLHMSNKHSPQQRSKILLEQLPYQNQREQKCGCGRTYESRSALKMHIKKKHNGVILKGTTEKGPRRSFSHTVMDKLRNIQIQSHFRSQRSSSDQDNKNDSEEEEIQREIAKYADRKIAPPQLAPHHQIPRYQGAIVPAKPVKSPQIFSSQRQPVHVPRPPPLKRQNEVEAEKPFRCGCGRPYSCSSALNLHIKKNHNWIVPYGTIGGPRGIRCMDETINQHQYQPLRQMQILCSQCRQPSQNSYFKCQTCTNHIMCPVCFWGTGTSHLGRQHDWVLKDKL